MLQYYLMKINREVFAGVNVAGAQLLVVTKYWDQVDTNKIYEAVKDEPCFCALGENRIESLEEKNLSRQFVHFVGRIQSRKIPDIVRFTSAVHSLDSLKHAEKLNTMAKGYDSPFGVFIQINVSGETQKGGIECNELSSFLESVKKLENLTILGISGMGRSNFTEAEKRAEFQLLIDLRNEFLPGKLISAGTSRDYKIALKEKIDLVRIGSAIVF